MPIASVALRTSLAAGALAAWSAANPDAAGRMTPSAAMRVARASHTATPLADGRVLIAGGYDPHMGALETAEVYDPTTDRFTAVGSMAAPRAAHTATTLADGRVLVVGGGAGRGAARTLRDVAELFDPARGTFAPAARMLAPRHKHAAARLPDGSVLVVGGSDVRDWGGRMTTVERYDPAARRFVPAGHAAFARFKLPTAVVTLRDGRILVAGGAEHAEVYDARRGTFAAVAGSLGAPRYLSAAAPLRDGSVLVTGGYAPSGGGLASTAQSFLYRP